MAAMKTGKFQEVEITTGQAVALDRSGIGNMPFKNGIVVIQLAQIWQALDPILRAHERKRQELLDAYAAKDEEGKFVVADGVIQFEKGTSEKEFNTAYQALLETPATIQIPLLDLAAVELPNMTPFTARALLPFSMTP